MVSTYKKIREHERERRRISWPLPSAGFSSLLFHGHSNKQRKMELPNVREQGEKERDRESSVNCQDTSVNWCSLNLSLPGSIGWSINWLPVGTWFGLPKRHQSTNGNHQSTDCPLFKIFRPIRHQQSTDGEHQSIIGGILMYYAHFSFYFKRKQKIYHVSDSFIHSFSLNQCYKGKEVLDICIKMPFSYLQEKHFRKSLKRSKKNRSKIS